MIKPSFTDMYLF